MALYDLLRFVVFALFLFSGAVAFGSWAVRTRRISPFSRPGQLIRKTTDPILAPIETWLLRRGSNPQNAGWWLVGVSIVGGIVVITTAQWIAVQLVRTAGAAASGPRGIVRLLIYYASQIVLLALIVRVIGSWFRVGRYNRWMRPAYFLTDWIVEPLRRVVPSMGMIDITPLVAWFLLLLARGLVLSVI
ncbi:MAG: hypothetical protein GTN62_04515 [Gemmatimonadales bacterium]|nr:hypothetical protein [Gemmatimonadales bacterium]NIN10601.1 hypothetical protein [Gemmatimonadales bacterium]NIN49363.1 hypothetical protein [Gemmatimonadales bacterium]NIP06827.1 hypothetical protein [Gemmatimonadales bacterium]NIR01501.1 hypothetical protein [Gemmatimonadales bacterium]